MELPLLFFRSWSLLMLWSVLHFYRRGYGCLESERSALLEIKAAFTPSSSLSSWGRSADCCSWDRVRCENATGRVVRLRLDSITEINWEDISPSFFHLNSSLFLPFQQLRSLSLSHNNIEGCLQNQGLDRLSGLPKLAYLDLSRNWKMDYAGILPSMVALSSLKALSLASNDIQNVSGLDRLSGLPKLAYLDLSRNWKMDYAGILPSMVALSSLKALSLASNDIQNVSGFRSWSQLSKLEYLDLSLNDLNENIIPYLARISSLKKLSLAGNDMSGMLQMEEFRKLSNLEVLDLGGNMFFGSIQPFVKEWASLKVLVLTYNRLNATLSPQGLCKLKNLQILDLSENEFTGKFPPCIGNLTSLRYLDISDNQLQVNLQQPNFLANLTSLEYILLSNIQLQGTFLLASLSNHSNLKALELADSRNNLVVETEDPIATPLYQLERIVLSMCNLNKDNGIIPSFLSSQYALNWIVLSHNNLRGSFPNWLLENKTVLHVVDLQNNSFNGPLVLPNHVNTTDMWGLDLSTNELSEEIPTNIGVLLPNLQYLNLSRNHLRGSIPSSFDHFSNLEALDLSNNTLSGEVSNVFGNSSLCLRLLDISGNMFRGRLPLQNSNMNSLSHLVLSGNHFTGDIPIILCNYSYLLVFDINDNQVSGTLPNCKKKEWDLRLLSAEENLLEGYIPTSLCAAPRLKVLNLSKNQLSGSVPHCLFNLTELRYLRLSHNALTGSFPIGLSNSHNALTTLDLGNNHLSGELPGWIGKALRGMRILLLKGNRLGGPIPNQVCQLKHLRILDLSQNLLFGEIPACIKYIGQEESTISPFPSSLYLSYEVRPFTFPSYQDLMAENWIRIAYGSSIAYGLRNSIVDVAEFTTKSRYDTYRGDALNYWTLLDLSCNQLVGHIPLGIGDLSWLQSLNLSNNLLTGPIPATFSGLKGIQSLDLSHNALTGQIPHQLVELYSLAAFSVAHNHLSGPTPRMESQFSTFGESSYEGNPDLCGPPLKKSCTSPRQPGPLLPSSYDHEGDDGAAVDSLIFFASLALAYIMGFWGSIAVLYFKTSWRRSLFLASDRYTVKVRELLEKLRRRCW
ncbi:putative LRR receptor-like serine/threonine-protein kinase GSO1 [Iris pallida]|uniref:LRR receptor-like serine/threonine-protein kinase GSO1 n=1 Tax=Iris pallida TaxID=29817 RepID=A0AAX6FLR7_IRIPA|nr:putative LRR receptor-like serine/threonine-protein kinase GSO1 [Iris pallida]